MSLEFRCTYSLPSPRKPTLATAILHKPRSGEKRVDLDLVGHRRDGRVGLHLDEVLDEKVGHAKVSHEALCPGLFHRPPRTRAELQRRAQVAHDLDRELVPDPEAVDLVRDLGLGSVRAGKMHEEEVDVRSEFRGDLADALGWRGGGGSGEG